MSKPLIIISDNKDQFFQFLDEYFTARKKASRKDDTEDDFISQVETARLTGVTVQTIIRWRKEGLLKPYIIKRKVFFRKSEVLDAMRNNERLIK